MRADGPARYLQNWENSENNDPKPNEASAEPVLDKEDAPLVPEDEEKHSYVDEEKPILVSPQPLSRVSPQHAILD